MRVREEEIEIREWGIRTIWCDRKLSFEAYDFYGLRSQLEDLNPLTS